jgi:hypothetical protein
MDYTIFSKHVHVHRQTSPLSKREKNVCCKKSSAPAASATPSRISCGCWLPRHCCLGKKAHGVGGDTVGLLQALLLTVLPLDLRLVRGDVGTKVAGEGGGGVTEVGRRRGRAGEPAHRRWEAVRAG